MESITNNSINAHDFIDEAKAHQSIHHFEETSHNQNDQYTAQPVWNNRNERLNELRSERIKE